MENNERTRRWQDPKTAKKEVEASVARFEANYNKVNAKLISYVNRQYQFTRLWQDPKFKDSVYNYITESKKNFDLN